MKPFFFLVIVRLRPTPTVTNGSPISIDLLGFTTYFQPYRTETPQIFTVVNL